MTLISTRFRSALLVLLSAVLCGWGARAQAQDSPALEKVVELNKKALASYDALDIEGAARQLKQALELCGAEGLDRHPAAARTHIHLGVVYVSGLKQRDLGLAEFKAALQIDPSIKVTRTLINPEVQAAFEEASMDASDPGPPAPAAIPDPSVSDGILHPPITEGLPGRPITIKAQVKPSLAAEKMVLAYRPEGSIEFLAREMDDIDKTGWFQAQIPVNATQGKTVAYYIEAQGAESHVLALSGTADDPHVIALSSGAAAEGALDVSGSSPADTVAAGADREQSSPLWMAVTVGGGYGYHSGTPEANQTDDGGKALKATGMGVASLLQISPEVGYFYSDSVILSLQARLQLVTGASEVKYQSCAGNVCKPSKFAPAVLAKATWLLGEPRALTPFVTMSAGAGEIRHIVSLQKLEGCGANGAAGTCKDTVRGGLGLLGPGAGFNLELTDSLLLTVSINALVGVPDFLANFDLNLGLAYSK